MADLGAAVETAAEETIGADQTALVTVAAVVASPVVTDLKYPKSTN